MGDYIEERVPRYGLDQQVGFRKAERRRVDIPIIEYYMSKSVELEM